MGPHKGPKRLPGPMPHKCHRPCAHSAHGAPGGARVQERGAHSGFLRTPPPLPLTLYSETCWSLWKHVLSHLRRLKKKFWKKIEKISTPQTRSNPTARRGRKHVEFFKIFMSKVTGLSAISMGSGIGDDKCANRTNR